MMRKEALASMDDRRFWRVLACVVLVGLAMRLFGADQHAFTTDESYELGHLSVNVLDVAADPDGFPPTFRWLLSCWVQVFGESTSRVLPILFGSGVVALAGVLGRRLARNEVGIACAIMSALSAHQIDFSQQCRSYSIYLFAVGLGMLAGWRLMERESVSRWIAFLGACFFALGTHYYSAFFITLMWLAVFVASEGRARWRWGMWAAVYVLICIPWVWCLRIDLTKPVPPEVFNAFDLTGLAYTFLTLCQGWTIGPSSIELIELPKWQGILAVAPWSLISLGCSAWLAWSARKAYGWRNWSWLVVFVIAMPVVSGVLSYAMHVNFVARYVAWIAVPYALLVGAGMQFREKSLSMLATYVLIAINLWSTQNRLFVDRYDRENYRLLAAEISGFQKSDSVLIMSHYFASAVRRELPKGCRYGVIALGSDEPVDWPEQLPLFAEGLSDSQEFTIVTEWYFGSDARIARRAELLDSIGATYVRRVSNTIEVYRAKSDRLREWLKSNPF